MSTGKPEPFETVGKVDLKRYAGLWFQVGRYPHFFQGGECAVSTARYTLSADGTILVENHCWADTVGGEVRQKVTAKARPADTTGSKLKVRFYGLFTADYYIIEIGDVDYSWAAVTTPKMNTLWILSRSPSLPEETYRMVLSRLEQRGFDLSKIIRTSKQ